MHISLHPQTQAKVVMGLFFELTGLSPIFISINNLCHMYSAQPTSNRSDQTMRLLVTGYPLIGISAPTMPLAVSAILQMKAPLKAHDMGIFIIEKFFIPF